MRRLDYLDGAIIQLLFLLATVALVSNAASTTFPSTSSACVAFVNSNPGRASVLADPTEETDKTACENLCKTDQTCVSYQINTNSGATLCWIQRDANNLNENNLFDQPNVTEWVKTNCSSSSSAGSATAISGSSTTLPLSSSSGTTSSSSSSSSSVCFANLYPGRVSGSADERTDLTNNAACESTCRADPTCKSYQINTNAGQTLCWIQRGTEPFTESNFYDQPNVVELVKTNCTSVCFANLYPGRISGLADEATDVTNNATCESTCRADTTCKSYQINTNAGQTLCWIQRGTEPFTESNLYDQPNVVELVKTNCTSVSAISSSSVSVASSTSATSSSSVSSLSSSACVAFANLYPGRVSGSADERTDLTNNATCESTCRSLPECKSYQINMNIGQTLCWIQRGTEPFTESNFYDQPNVVELVKTNCSATGSSATSFPVPSTSIPTSSTTFPTSSSSMPCVVFTNVYPGRVSGLAEEMTTVTNNATCESTCRADTTCKSYQINTNVGQTLCWIQKGTDPFTESNFYNQPNVVELVKTNCTSASSSTTFPLPSSSVSSTTLSSTTSFPISTTSMPRSSTSFPTPSTSPGCVAFANLYPGRVSGSADERTDLTNNATCESTCRADTTCKSYQINTNAGQTLCWIQRGTEPFTESNFYDQANVVELVKTNCSSGSSSTSFPIPSTSTSISSTTFPISSTSIPCIAFVNQYPGSQSGGAVGMPNLPDTPSCEAACRADAACVSYQIDTNPNNILCWIQRSTNAFDPFNLFNQPNIIEYVKTSCSNASSSSSASSASSLSSSGSTISRVSTRLTTLPSSTSATGSTVSTTTRTTRPPTQSTARMCSYNFTATYNMNMRGGTETRWVTLDECQQACLANLQCIAIDVNSNPGQIYCYLILNRVPLTSYPGVAHYDLSRGNDCPTPSSTSVASTSATTTPGTPTCIYKKLEGANADGGNPVGSNILESQCLQLCNLNPACLSFEYAFGSKTCFIHTTNDISQNSPCCNRYVLQCSSSPCTDDFLLQSGYSPSILQGYPQSDVTTLDQCKLRCLNDASCTRFFYYAQNPRSQITCYLYYTATDSVIPTQGIDLYIRQRCLHNVSITVATTTTTPVPTPAAGSCVIDLVFVVDSSGSIRDDSTPTVDNWQLMKLFIKSLINSSIHYGVYMDHVGIVEFSDYARVVFDLQSSLTTPLSGLIQAIDDMPYLGAETNTGEGLRLGREMFANSSRPNALRMLVLLTDGHVTSRWKDGFWTEVVKLNQSNIIRYGIGVSKNVSLEELYAVALYKNAVELADSYADLPNDVDRASIFINSFPCQQNVKPTTALTSTSSSTTKSTTSTTSIRTSLSSTSTTTSRSSSTSTTATAITTVARNFGGEGLFGAYKTTSATGTSTTNFTGVLANRFNLFNIASDQFAPGVGSNQYFYTEICAGIPQSTTCLLRTTGAYPPLSFDWLSNAQNDIDSGCRGGVLAVAVGSSTSLSQLQTAGGSYSSEQLLTSWSMFSITDTMKYNSSLLSVYSSNTLSTPGQFPFDSPYVNPTSPWMLYNAATTQYSCIPSVTAYFFSMSVGIAAGQTASVVLSVDGVTYEMVRLGNMTTGTTTLARSVLAPCSDTGYAKMTLSSGAVVPGNYLISFTAFPYQRRDGLNSVSWTAFRTSNFTASNPLTFDSWIVQSVTVQTNTTVTIPRTGYYYVYISTGIHAQSTVNLNLLRNNQILFGLRRRATNYNGIDTIGHGLVILLNQNDVLQVQSLESGYSSATGKHASFFGMLLYDS